MYSVENSIAIGGLYMRVTIEIDHKSELDKLKALFKTLKINKVSVLPESETKNHIPLRKGDKRIDPKELFGIWSTEPRDLDTIRKSGWDRENL